MFNVYGAKNYDFYSRYFIFQQRRSEMESRETEHDRKITSTVPKKRYKKNNYFSDEEDFSE